MGAATIELQSSHVAMVSHPVEVTELIETAAAAVGGLDGLPGGGRRDCD
jgi:hypothetical protein